MANNSKSIKTGGGSHVGKSVQTGGDFVGRDQTTIINIIPWAEISDELIENLNKTVQLEKEKQVEELKKKGKTSAYPNTAIDGLAQKIIKFVYFDWAKAEKAYRDKVINLYDCVRVLGSSADVPLGNLFTQVYILDNITARQRHDIEVLRNQRWDRHDFQRQPGKRRQGLELVETNQNLFILGKPGAGKTTFLKYITIQAARKQLPRIPIFVSLNQWADSKWGKGDRAALLPFLVEQFAICDFPDAEIFIDYILKAGRALVLFDGLDEVKQEKDQRRRLTRLLQDFAQKYNKSQHLITCRIAASEYAFSGFIDVEVADFTPDQVREYARNWFGDQGKKFDTFTKELAKTENLGLAELCNTPLLLSLLCLTFDNNMHFPPSRAELYEDALETLLRKWDANRQIQRDEIYRTLTYKRKLQLLMSIAIPTFEKGELFFRQRDLEKWIVEYLVKLPGAPRSDTLDGTAILKAIEAQHSILVERAQGIYSFSHLTFQEFLTAHYLTENKGSEVASQLIRKHLTDSRWREVFLLTASLLDDATAFVSMMQSTIASIIADAPNARQFLTWAYYRTRQANVSIEQCRTVQLAYILLVRALAFERSSERNLEKALLRTIDLVRASEEEGALIQSFEHTRSLVQDRERALDLQQALRLALALARSTTPLVGFDYCLYYSWAYTTLFTFAATELNPKWQAAMWQLPNLIEGVAGLANEAGLPHLAQCLTIKSCPLPNAHVRDWQEYADTLWAILRDERDLCREWNFNNAEVGKLSNYFYANELLVQFLKVAVVSDRQAVLNNLLLPPKSE